MGQGRHIGGPPALGYKIVYQDGKRSDLAIDENEVELVKTVFDTLEATGGNIAATAKRKYCHLIDLSELFTMGIDVS